MIKIYTVNNNILKGDAITVWGDWKQFALGNTLEPNLSFYISLQSPHAHRCVGHNEYVPDRLL